MSCLAFMMGLGSVGGSEQVGPQVFSALIKLVFVLFRCRL